MNAIITPITITAMSLIFISYILIKEYNQSKKMIREMNAYIKEQTLHGIKLESQAQVDTVTISIGELYFSKANNYKHYRIIFKGEVYKLQSKNRFLAYFYKKQQQSIYKEGALRKQKEVTYLSNKFKMGFIEG